MKKAIYTEEDKRFTTWMKNYYNNKVRNRKKGYEHSRWFESPRHRKQFLFSRKSILHHLKNINPKNILEIGCGPGTWTKVLLGRFPKAKITCLDLSKEMIKELKRILNQRE